MIAYGWVAIGGAFGSALRFGLDRWLTHALGHALPWGTIVINCTGSFVIGLATALFASGTGASSPEFRQFILVGLCGGFTTFSSFSLQTVTLLNADEPGRAALNVILSLTLCLIAVALGTVLPGAFTTVSRSVGA
ncbi:fluoride efflux transporter CrcB [Ancylobacter sp. G4_0304]|uniref:fluoride efflux transporter CrcB n=1 Tax=Ancylobacter sp. G4_0304 TaxID=3114289 RepID=UPI0039C6B232